MARRLLVLFVTAVLLAACSDDDPAIDGAASTTSSTTSTAPTSSTETSASPDPDEPTDPGTSATLPDGGGTTMEGPAGSGAMDYRLVPERSEFCYQISIDGIGEPTEAHVHRNDDEVVLALQPPEADSSVDTCAATDALLIEELQAAPENFYLDVHGPGGLLRAPLGS